MSMLAIVRELRLERALGLVWRSAPRWSAARVAILFVQSGLPLAQLYALKLVIDGAFAAAGSLERSAAIQQLAAPILLLASLALLWVLCESAAKLIQETQGQLVTDYVHDILHGKSIAVDLAYYEDASYFDALHQAQKEAPHRPTRVLSGLVHLAQNGITLAALSGFLFRSHWSVPILLIAASVPGVLVRLRHASTLHRWQCKQTPTERKAEYLTWVLTGQAHAKEVRLLDLGPVLVGRFGDLRRRIRDERFAIALRQTLTELLSQVSGILAVFACLALIAYRTLQGAMTVGEMVMYFSAFQRGQGCLRNALSSLAALYEDSLFLSHFYRFMDLGQLVGEPQQPAAVPVPMRSGIEFRHVSFKYPMGAASVLEDICLAVRPGEVVALVGENGSGKSTLIKLLCRLYDPADGSITLDGVDLRSFRTQDLRREISVVFQDYAHYQVTARENIWFGNVEIPPRDARIERAAQSAGAESLICGLPEGYDTHLGKWFDSGVELSIGEWQKIALARAFVREAQVMVLDEPSSSLDARAEYELFRSFRERARGRSVILISHRLSTVKTADRIHVLEAGRIVESGSHEELMERKGAYARLFTMQAQYYR